MNVARSGHNRAIRLSPEQSRRLWLWWAVASSGGLALGLAAALVAVTLSLIPLTLLIEGLGIGLGQWLVLRRFVPRSAWWIAASALGMQLGTVAGYALSPGSLGPVTVALIGSGVGLGAGQWLLLRRYIRRARWWILASAIGIVAPVVAGPLLGSASIPGAIRTALLSPLYGATSGLALVWLLGQPYGRRPATPNSLEPPAEPAAAAAPAAYSGAERGTSSQKASTAILRALHEEREALRRRLTEVEGEIGTLEGGPGHPG